jgi:hypothetical protein
MTSEIVDRGQGRNSAPDYKPRRAQRLVVVGGSATLIPQELYEVDVKVQDVSTCGFMAECDAALRIGSYVTLDIPGIGSVEAQVRWQLGARTGGMFLDPISLSRCEWTAQKACAAA